MSELLLPVAEQRFISAKIKGVGLLLDTLENKPPVVVQTGVERIITDSYTSAVDSVPDLGFALRTVALGAHREVTGLGRLQDNLYPDIESRVDDEIVSGELYRLVEGQELFISSLKKPPVRY